MGEAGFNMRKSKTNIHSLQDRFMEEGNNESKSCKVLCYSWNSEGDVLNVASDKPLKNNSWKQNIFVKSRVDEIERVSEPNFCKHCPENENPVNTWLRKCEN